MQRVARVCQRQLILVTRDDGYFVLDGEWIRPPKGRPPTEVRRWTSEISAPATPRSPISAVDECLSRFSAAYLGVGHGSKCPTLISCTLRSLYFVFSNASFNHNRDEKTRSTLLHDTQYARTLHRHILN